MVYSVGNYCFKDYIVMGLFLLIIYLIMVLIFILLVFLF